MVKKIIKKMYDWQDLNEWEQIKSVNSTETHHLGKFWVPLKLF